MSFVWPSMLVALLVVPVLAYGYLQLLRRRARLRAELGTMGLAGSPSGQLLGRKRHVPPVLFLLGISLLVFGLARPETTLALPRKQGTVILAFDTSNSMRAKDLKPNRLAAAKKAADGFVADQPSSIRIGVVAFSGSGFIVQQPTHTKQDVLDAIKRIGTRGSTSIGQAIVTSLNAVAGKPIPIDQKALENGQPQPNVHFIGSAVVILLTDGENTSRLDPLAIAPVAAQAGVRIYPIGLGSANGGVVDVGGYRIATSLDANLLRGIAQRSGGKYFRAQDANALSQIYHTIDLQLTVNGRKTEITALVAGTGLFLFLVGAFLSMRWYGRVL
ncbi:MAG TPA: VWA domain-containing protein [Acidimicrobiia bacterium]|nr:VWA domain-containing protein [Acidimicrobiia bacterium]